MTQQTLLVVDDEPNITFSVKETLESSQLRVITAATGTEALAHITANRPDAVLLDVRLPGMSGMDVYDQMRDIDRQLPVIIMTAFSRTDTAIEATRRGAFDYLVKPVDLTRLREVVERALEIRRLRRIPALIGHESPDVDPGEADVIVGQSPAMQEVYKTIGRVAGLDAPVLILGESGTGKELVARAIHHYGNRSQQTFLAINCAALSESLLESELFGHEKGAFTGADQRRIGKFEQMHGGTILLDEIGDMTAATQAKALRLLQQQQFERLGGNTTIQTDVRVIAATNRPLAQMVEEGRFRRDLFYRLNTFTIELPPLRSRPEDIPLLARFFLERYSEVSGVPPTGITPSTLDCLAQHSWPGNVREFASALRFAVVHAVGGVVTPESLPESCRRPAGVFPGTASHVAKASAGPFDLSGLVRDLLASGQPGIYRQLTAATDRVILDLVLAHVRGNKVQAADLLGISRQTLRSKLRQLQETDPSQTLRDEFEDETE